MPNTPPVVPPTAHLSKFTSSKPLSATGVNVESFHTLDEHLLRALDHFGPVLTGRVAEKVPPKFNARQLALLCEKSPSKMLRLLERASEFGLSAGDGGEVDGERRERSVSLDQAQDWVRAVGEMRYQRRPGQPACVVAVTSPCSGACTAQMAVSLAQGLSLKGYRVLAVDLDMHGAMSALLGVDLAAVDVDDTFVPLTLMPTIKGQRADLLESVRPTYWAGVDIVAGGAHLSRAELNLPLLGMTAQAEGRRYNFFDVLHDGLRFGLSDDYDYIVVEAPPGLSYIAMNGLWAADALLVGVAMNPLQIVSAVEFVNTFTDFLEVAAKFADAPKRYAWAGFVPTCMDPHEHPGNVSVEMRRLYEKMFGDFSMPCALPSLDEALQGEPDRRSTVFDYSKYTWKQKQLEAARGEFDKLVAAVDHLTRSSFWKAA